MAPVSPAFRYSLVLSLVAILAGFVLGGVFGAAEDSLKDYLAEQGGAALEQVYGGDEAAMNAVVAKSWSYFKRAHMHAGAMGTAALACILALLLLSRRDTLAVIAAWSVAVGSLLYPVFWLLAGMSAPAAGSTDAAKEALNFVAIPGAGGAIVGVVLTIVCVLRGQSGGALPPARPQ